VAGAVLGGSSVGFAGEHDLLIRHGKVYDGTGNGWFYADVAIDGQRVSAIGDLSGDTAKKEIDATNLAVTPGFIDVHTHVDDDIFPKDDESRNPLAENFIRDGVTTIVSGNCGGSVLDVAAFFDRIAKQPAAVNHATLIGHNTVISKVKGNVATKMTDAQLAEAEKLVARGMEDGAIGFSTGLIYTPGQWSDTEEIIALAREAGSRGGIYATHMRSEGMGIMKAIDEALRVGKEAGCRVEISHFKLSTSAAIKFGRGTSIDHGSDLTLAKVAEARAAGEEVWLDQYPYTASSTTLSTMLPDWVLEKGGDEAKKTLTDPEQVKKVLADMHDNHEVTNKRTDLSYAVIASAKGHPEYSGKSVKQIAQLVKLKKDHGDAPELMGGDDKQEVKLPDVTMEEQYRTVIDIYLGGGASCVFHSMDEIEVTNILKSPLVGIASDSGLRIFGSGMPHPRGYGTNARVLGRYVRELKAITLEDAIRKMTSQPATAFRMKDRGTLRVGAFADINVFDPATIIDKATFDAPHQYSAGFKATIVNGVVVFDGEKMTGEKPGIAIKGPAAK
jgi:N-acyl-D-amino-acid deacylase